MGNTTTFRVILPLFNLFWLRKGEFNCSVIMQLVFVAAMGQIPKCMNSFVYCNKCEMMNERQVKNKTEVSSHCDKDRRSKRRNTVTTLKALAPTNAKSVSTVHLQVH